MTSPRPHPGSLVCRKAVPAMQHCVLGGKAGRTDRVRLPLSVCSVGCCRGPRDESGRWQSAVQWLVSKACSACHVGLWEARPGEVGGRAEAPSGGVAVRSGAGEGGGDAQGS